MNKYLLILLLAVSAFASDDTLVVYDGVTGGGTNDATLHSAIELGPSLYADPYLEVRNGTADLRYTIISFPDIDDVPIPPCTEDTTVELTLTLGYESTAEFGQWIDSIQVFAYRVTDSWSETNNWTTGFGSPAWWSRGVSAYWLTLDEGSPLDGVTGAAFDTVWVGNVEGATVTINIPLTIYDAWLSTPATNYGVLLATAGTGTDYDGEGSLRRFFSSDYPTASLRPKLSVLYNYKSSSTFHCINDASDLPYTTSATYDTICISADSIDYTSPGAAITLSHAHSKILFNGNTLFVDSLGIQISADSCKLYNGTVEQRSAATREYGVMVNIASTVDSCEINTLSVHARTANSAGLRAGNVGNTGGPNGEIFITGGDYTSYVSDFDTREYQYTAPIFIADDDASPSATRTRAYVGHVTIDSCPHVGIVMNGGTLLCDSNFVRVDAQNHYTYPSGNIFYGTANAYGIAIDRIGRNCKVIGNTIRSGVNHGGGRGIALDGQASWTTWRSIEVAYNDDSTHAGPDANYGATYQGVGLRVRDTGTDTLYFHHNTVVVVSDTALATAHTGVQSCAIWLSNAGEHWRFEYNTIKAMTVPSLYGVRGAGATCPPYSTCASDARAFVLDEMTAPDSIILRYNHIESDVIPISYGEVNSGSSSDCGSNVYSFNDTIVRPATANYADEWGNDGTWAASLASCDFLDNYYTDPYFTGDTTIDRDGTGPYEIWWRKSLAINVVDSNATAVEGAEVLVVNYNDDTVFVDTTDASGLVDTAVVAYRLYQYGQTDSTYNPFDIIVQTETDTVIEAKSFGWATSGTIQMIVAPTAAGSISIATATLVGTSSYYDIIGLPRDKGIAQDGRLHIFPATETDAGYNNTATRYYYSADSGDTWTGVNYNIDDGGAYNYHVAAFGLPGRGIFTVVPDNVSVYFTQMFFKAPCTTLTDAATQHHLSAATTNRGTIAARGDTAWAAWRYTGDLDTLFISMSVDTFGTQTMFSRNVGGAANNHRIGLFTDDNGLPNLFWYKYSTGFYKWPWHGTGSGFIGDADSTIITDVNADADRAFTAVYADGSWHLIYGHDDGANAYLIHCRDTGAAWLIDTITYHASFDPLAFAPKAGVRNDTIFLGFGNAASGATATSFALKVFDPATDTWQTDSTVLTSGYTCNGQIQIPSKIPEAYFDFVPYWFIHDGTVDSLMFGKILLPTSTNSPPVVAGIPDQAINEGASFSTISLDNYVTDPDNADAELSWSYYYLDNANKTTTSIATRVATITALDPDTNGVDTIVFRVEDPSSAADEDTAIFTITAVNDAPVVAGIPDQAIYAGGNFSWVGLSAYVTDIDNTDNQMTWTYIGGSNLVWDTVAADPLVISLAVPNISYTGIDTIIFIATDPSAAADQDTAVFTTTANPVAWHKIKGLKRGHKPAEQGGEE